MNQKPVPTLPNTAIAAPLPAMNRLNNKVSFARPGAWLAAILAFLFLLCPFTSSAQFDGDPETLIKRNDSLLFDVGFNHCDLSQFESLLSGDFRFYHDKAGVTSTKAAFLRELKEKHCAMSYRARRELVPGSMQVFLLHRNDTVYGILQMGTHRFYAVEKGKQDKLTSTAKFSHTWLLEEGELKLSHVISYDHREPAR